MSSTPACDLYAFTIYKRGVEHFMSTRKQYQLQRGLSGIEQEAYITNRGVNRVIEIGGISMKGWRNE
jgi:hypothetical protein